jgi:hypothetical protein
MSRRRQQRDAKGESTSKKMARNHGLVRLDGAKIGESRPKNKPDENPTGSDGGQLPFASGRLLLAIRQFARVAIPNI